jgi:hypothetical protein
MIVFYVIDQRFLLFIGLRAFVCPTNHLLVVDIPSVAECSFSGQRAGRHFSAYRHAARPYEAAIKMNVWLRTTGTRDFVSTTANGADALIAQSLAIDKPPSASIVDPVAK